MFCLRADCFFTRVNAVAGSAVDVWSPRVCSDHLLIFPFVEIVRGEVIVAVVLGSGLPYALVGVENCSQVWAGKELHERPINS